MNLSKYLPPWAAEHLDSQNEVIVALLLACAVATLVAVLVHSAVVNYRNRTNKWRYQ